MRCTDCITRHQQLALHLVCAHATCVARLETGRLFDAARQRMQQDAGQRQRAEAHLDSSDLFSSSGEAEEATTAEMALL